jgi:adenylyl-sulfate kinase
MAVIPASPTRLTPQQRLEGLCDPGSLEPLMATGHYGPCLDRIGVEARLGRVDGRPIVCYAQDSAIAGGSVGTAEAEVVVHALRRARQHRIPVVAFLESAGARLQEGAAALGGFGRIFTENVALSGLVPQISVITGTSAGGGCYSPALTDFVVMTEQASMFLTGPRIVKQALGEDVTASALGGIQVQQRNGVCDFVVADDHEALGLIRELLGYLPQNGAEWPPSWPSEPGIEDDPGRLVPARSRSFYDVRAVIRALVDGGRFLEVSRRWARNMVVGFARMEGRAIGVVANQSRHLGGVIDVDASQKGAKFVRTCHAHDIPMLVLVDTPGFMPGTRQEAAGVIRHGADLLRAFAATTSARVTVILRKAFGGAFITMNSKDLGADASFAWPSSEIGIMGSRAAVEILHRRKLIETTSREHEATRLGQQYAQACVSAEAALRLGVIDSVVEPVETRRRVADALLGGRRSGVRSAPRGCAVWFTGPPASGKSTVAALVEQELRARGVKVEVLDGDVVRRNLSKGLGFSKEDRDTNIRRIAFVADVLSRNGVCVLAAAISPYRATRDEARALMGDRFIEVHLKASLMACAERDPKGLYAKALRGELPGFTSVSDPYEEPLTPELVLDTERETPEESAERVLALLDRHERPAPGAMKGGSSWETSRHERGRAASTDPAVLGELRQG